MVVALLWKRKRKAQIPREGDYLTKYIVTFKSFYRLSLYIEFLFIEFAIVTKSEKCVDYVNSGIVIQQVQTQTVKAHKYNCVNLTCYSC